jgi:hypothetical protein
LAKTRIRQQPQDQASTGETPSGYFRRLFTDNPKLLKGRSNEEVLKRWLADHPGEKAVPDRIKYIVANVKSVLRERLRKKPGHRPAEPKAAEATAGEQATPPTRAAAKLLDILEEQIDECMTFARNLDREGLDDVIARLRRARNEVVWKSGQ